MRLAGLALAAVVLGGCATAELERDQVAPVIEDAFDDAGVDATAIEVSETTTDRRWSAELMVDDTPVRVEVDAGRGTIVAIDLGESGLLDEAQLTTIARHADNPTDRDAQRRRWARLLGALVLFLAGGYGLARRARIREESRARGDTSV